MVFQLRKPPSSIKTPLWNSHVQQETRKTSFPNSFFLQMQEKYSTVSAPPSHTKKHNKHNHNHSHNNHNHNHNNHNHNHNHNNNNNNTNDNDNNNNNNDQQPPT